MVTGVSAHRELLERAVAASAELVLAHHGLFWDFLPRALSEAMAERLRIALGAELSVAAYHLPLDAHPEIGNNALLRDGLGFEPSPEPFGHAKDRPIGVVGRSAEGIAGGRAHGARARPDRAGARWSSPPARIGSARSASSPAPPPR